MKLSIKIFLPIIIIFHTIVWYISFFILKQNDIFGLYNSGFLDFLIRRQGEFYSTLLMLLSAFNILLATRAKFLEKIFSGLDKVYIAHKYSGYLILVLLFLHFFLIKGSGIAGEGFFKYSLWIANPLFYTFLASIFISALPNIPVVKKVLNVPYHIWKYTHYLMGIIFILGTYHSVGVQSFTFSNPILSVYMYLIYWVGFSSLIYKSFWYRLLKRRYKYLVKNIASGNDNQINIFTLSPAKENKKIKWKAGQFALFKFLKNGLKEVHPFTISNAVNENGEVRISIKTLGDWTGKISRDIKKGDAVIIDGPYGNFVSKKEKNNDEIWIAGGIGVTPYLAILQDYKKENNLNKKILFVWSVKDKSEAVFEKEIVENLPSNIEFLLHDTAESGFFKFESLSEKINKESKKDLELYICGPEAMREAVIKDVKLTGINKINFEEFKFR